MTKLKPTSKRTNQLTKINFNDMRYFFHSMQNVVLKDTFSYIECEHSENVHKMMHIISFLLFAFFMVLIFYHLCVHTVCVRK